MSGVEEKKENKVMLGVYIDPSKKKDIDDFIFDQRIRNFQDAYRDILDLGFEQFQKIKKGGKK